MNETEFHALDAAHADESTRERFDTFRSARFVADGIKIVHITQALIVASINDCENDWSHVGTLGKILEYRIAGYDGIMVRIGTETTFVYENGIVIGEVEHDCDIETYFDSLANIVS